MVGNKRRIGLRRKFGDEPYTGIDAPLVRRYAASVFAVQALLLLVFAPVAPPDPELGTTGWVSMAALITCSTAIAMSLLAWPAAFSLSATYGLAYLGMAYITVAVWLTGDPLPTQMPLLLLWAVFIPPWNGLARSVPFLGALALAAAAPLVHGGWNGTIAAELSGHLTVWLVVGGLVGYRMHTLREREQGLAATGREVEQLAYTDSLTGLANRRAFDRDVKRALALAEREDHPLTVVLADVNRFKEINDRYGHITGDRYLCGIAKQVESVLRDGDAGYRWGGDEFAMMLATDAQGAERACERLALSLLSGRGGKRDVSITLTFGVAEFTPGMDRDALIELADQQLIGNKDRVTA